jgi:hypothetical protein
MRRITDPQFKYVPAAKTDIRLTIRREQKRLAKLEELKQHFDKVTPIRKEAK